jgi:hypothetical protein
MQLAAASASGKSSFTAVVLAEASERLLWLRAVKLWNLVVTTEQSSLLRQSAAANVALAVASGYRISARQSWAHHLSAALAATGCSWISISLSPLQRSSARRSHP